MNLRENFKTGLKELSCHKLRSFLTMLGVILGVMAVVSMVSIAEGGRIEAEKSFKDIGLDTLVIDRIDVEGNISKEASIKSPYGIKIGDVLFFKNIGGEIEDAVGLRICSAKCDSNEKYTDFNLFGTFSEFADISNFSMREGRFFSAQDVKNQKRVCVLGFSVAEKLFPAETAIGKPIRFSFKWYTVAGVLEPKAVSSMQESKNFSFVGENNNIYIPITSAINDFNFKYEKIAEDKELRNRRNMEKSGKLRFTDNPLSKIIIQVKDINSLKETALLVSACLERRHREIPDFKITMPLEILEMKQRSQGIFNIVMAAIAGISLLVGGIGIMNIMLASITQRIREIGIRRCLGATKKDIHNQFLIECLFITVLGGLIGIVLGIFLGKVISAYAQWKSVVSFKAIIISFAVSLTVGVIFGLYPAKTASEINPIDALRYE